MIIETKLLSAGKILTVTADVFSSGLLTRLPDSAGGGDPFSPIPISASSVLIIGPFSASRRYVITSNAGLLVVSVADLLLPAAGVTDAAAATAVSFPVGGTGTAAGGWDTAGNRDLAIARFAAALADIASLRTAVNTLLARERAAGKIL